MKTRKVRSVYKAEEAEAAVMKLRSMAEGRTEGPEMGLGTMTCLTWAENSDGLEPVGA